MGGRYGASDDGSSDYQDRRPDDDDRSDEQQTIAEAIQAVADQQQAANRSTSGRTDDDGNSDGGDADSGQHPFTTLRPGTNSTGSSTLQDIDQQIAEYVADELVEGVRWTVEETEPDENTEQ
jgi:hypothetical protein